MSDFVTWQINIGQVAGFFVTVFGLAFIGAMLNRRVVELEKDVRKIADVLTRLAVQTERLDQQANRLERLENDIRALRHGEGFVLPLGSRSSG